MSEWYGIRCSPEKSGEHRCFVSEASGFASFVNHATAKPRSLRLHRRGQSLEASLKPEIMFSNNTTGVGEICYVSESPMRILVVEDDEKIASFVVNGLKQSGFAVDRAKDGEQGLDFALIGLLRRCRA